MIEKIGVKEVFDFSELERRLRKVKLKGFSDIEIYRDSQIEIGQKTPEEIKKGFFIPQPTIYRNGFLDRIDELSEIFSAKGIDIFRLTGGVDYTAHSNGERTDWTIIPPVVEVVPIYFTNSRLNYTPLLSEEVRELMKNTGCDLNPELIKLSYNEYPFSGLHPIKLVCDGSHRIHSGLEKEIPQNVVLIHNPQKGFPYYAAPKPYSKVHVEEQRPEEGARDKTHILESPAHKSLYRLFPTGEILNGTVRPE